MLFLANTLHSIGGVFFSPDDKGEEVVPQTVQLIAGRMGQEYNQRKNRKGDFWEDHNNGNFGLGNGGLRLENRFY